MRAVLLPLVLLPIVALPGRALAGSFELLEGDTDQNASAYAGQAAKAYDAGTAWANPAGLVRVGHDEIDTSINVIDPEFSFTGSNTIFPDPAASGAPNRQVGAISAAAVPATFSVWQLGPDLAAGFAVKSPFGARIDYPSDWIGRFQSIVSFLTDIEAEPSLSYAINRSLSIGGGPVIDFLSLRETQAVRPLVGSQYGDVLADVSGTNFTAGYNLGALWELDGSTRFGLTYRSRLEHRVDIRQTLSQSQGLLQSPLASLIQALLRSQNTPGFHYAKGVEKFNLPDSVDGSFYHQITPEWAVMGEAIWTHWQIFNNITVQTFGNGNRPIVNQFGFHNTIFASIGAGYRPYWNRRLLLQGGAGYDENPFGDGARQAQIPTVSRALVSFGATYDLSRSLSLAFAYNHYFGLGGRIDATGPTLANALQLPAGRLTGSYSNEIDTYSVGVKIRF